MNIITASIPELIGSLLGFTLTLFVFSYAWGENPLFKIAVNIFVGVAAGYAAIITFYNILLPQLILPFINGNRNEMIIAVVYLIPSVLILMKLSPRLSTFGNPAMAILVGIGAASAVGGAVLGTLFPQVVTLMDVFENRNFLNAGVILIGSISTLLYFQFSIRKKTDQHPQMGQVTQVISWIGKTFIAITFGTLFAGVYFAALIALIERLSGIWVFLRDFFGLAIIG